MFPGEPLDAANAANPWNIAPVAISFLEHFLIDSRIIKSNICSMEAL